MGQLTMTLMKTKEYSFMKRIAILVVMSAAMLVSCSKTDMWIDNDDPRIYIPRQGVSFNTAWMLDTEEYTMSLGVYLGGVRPDNQTSDIEVTFAIDPGLITTYNDDVTQLYSGQVIELPSDCYEISGNKVVIPGGSVSAMIPIKVFTDKVDALGMGPDDIYAIPVKLVSTSKYDLLDDATKLEALYGIKLDQPRFYFYINRNAGSSVSPVARRVIFGQEPQAENFLVTSYGLTIDQPYTLTIGIDPSKVPAGQQLLPADAYELPSTSVTIPQGSLFGKVPVKIINDNVVFRQTYYLPVSITAASKYGGDPVKGTLLLRIEVKNDYEWNYVSKMTITSETTGRSGSYQVDKAPTSYDETTLRIQMITNSTLAGGTTGTSSTYNNKYYRLKVVPNPDNNRDWGVEIILITDEGSNNSPATLELDPDHHSYYDWDYETFYLYYRWKHTDGKWIWATEVLEAQF
jgi:hypothetical protein